MDNSVQTLNYSLYALEELKEFQEAVTRTWPEGTKSLACVRTMLQKSVKFILPNNADLIDIRKLSDSHFDMLRLPFPIVALEIPWIAEDGRMITEGALKESPSMKRIVLAWDEQFAEHCGFDVPREPGVSAVSIYHDANVNRWLVAAVGAFIPRDNEITRIQHPDESGNAAERLVAEQLFTGGWAKPGAPTHGVEYFLVLPEMFAQMSEQIGATNTAARAQLDIRDELRALWEFCLTVNCVNVRQETVESTALNKKRIKNGKLPFFSYRVLQLNFDGGSGPGRKNALVGDRVGPRQHLRRGHPRRLVSGQVTYVRGTVVGNPGRGHLDKSYDLRRP